MPHFNHDRVALYYTEQGSGEPLILINGLGRTSRDWGGFAAGLAGTFRVITPDNRGAGESLGQLPRNLRIETMARDTIALMDHLGLESAHIAGLSMGGMITLATALAAPERVRTMTIINSGIAGYGWLFVTPSAAARMALTALMPGRTNRIMEPNLLGDQTPRQIDQLRQHWEKVDAARGVPVAHAVRHMIAVHHFRPADRLRTLRVPALILTGSADRLVPPACSRELGALLPDCRQIVIPGGGHEMTLDRHDEIIPLIESFTLGILVRNAA